MAVLICYLYVKFKIIVCGYKKIRSIASQNEMTSNLKSASIQN